MSDDKQRIAELERKVEEYRTLWQQADDRARMYQRQLERNERARREPTTQDLEEVDVEDKAPPAIAGYMHTYQPATRPPRAPLEVLPPEQRASWARGKVPGIDR